ncbi:MAG: T9SS type A sorting domain-containing protein [Flavobacteriales bacterium]|nr:T9SS type A sorting domain-containing protein [Flavobacteriales bacterium]
MEIIKRNLILAIVFLPAFLLAQSLSISGPTIVNGNPNTTITQKYSITNNTNDTLHILCKKIIIDTAAGTINYFCLGDDCYGEDVYTAWAVATFLPFQTRDSVFIGYYAPFGLASQAVIKYKFYPYNDLTDTTTITITYNGIISSINQMKNSFSVFPNPVQNTLYLSEYVNSVKVSDLNGKLIISQKNNVNTIDVSRLSKGVYFIDVDGVKSKFVKY